jgi:hypothetical protein
LVFFSSALPRPPSAAEPLTPPLAFRAGPPAGPGPSRARTRARSFGGDVPGFLRSMFAWTGRAGTRPGTGPRARAPGRAGPGAGSHDGGFDDRPGWRLRGFPSSGRRAPPALFSPAWVILLLRLPCLVCLCLVVPARALGADRGRARCLDAFARLSGSLAAPRGYSCAGLRPLFFASSSALARAGPGPSASSPAGAAGRD